MTRYTGPSFEERQDYVRGLLVAVDGPVDDASIKRLVRTWVFEGFSRMVTAVQALRGKK